MRFLIVTGMSGAGKTIAIRYLEDLGALCVDNLPPMMLFPFMESCTNSNIKNPLIAIVADVRSGEFFDAYSVVQIINDAKTMNYDIQTLFISASNDELVNRYKESRRDHPLMSEGLSLQAAIEEEALRLQPLKETANILYDSTGNKPKNMRNMLAKQVFTKESTPSFFLEILSFGFKRGLPRNADLVFDVRFLPNPFYIPELGHQTGLEEPVKDFVLNHPTTLEFLDKCMDMLQFLLPEYQKEGKSRMVLAIGCTGGAHRSVAISEYIYAKMQQNGQQVSVYHRDILLEQAMWTTGD